MNIYRKPIFAALFIGMILFVAAGTLFFLSAEWNQELKMERLMAPKFIEINYVAVSQRFWEVAKYILAGSLLLIVLCGGFLFLLWKNRQAESKLHQSQWLASFADGIEEGLVLFDKNLVITYWNRGMERISGDPASEIVGQNVFARFSFLKDPQRIKAFHDVLEGKSIIEKEVPIHYKGKTLLVNQHFMPLYDSGKTGIIGGMCFVYDVAAAKEKEKTLQKLEQQLFQAQKMESLGQLAGGIAHDFNNILTTIIGYADAADIYLNQPEKAKLYLEKIPEQSKRAAQLIARLLLFARHTEFERHPLDLVPFLKEIIQILQRTLPENIKLETNFSPQIPLINADLTQIQQVVMNLATNARDAMPQGGKLILSLSSLEIDESFAQSHAEARPGPYILFSMRDTGCGMTSEVKKHLFEPFFTTKEKGKGTGLGLSMVYGIVKQHGGFVDVYSEEGKGTEIKIYFPIAAGKAEAAPIEEVETLPRGTEKILLVEDDAQVRDAVELMLRRQGYQVSSVSNGKEALETYRRNLSAFDLVISDMVMPKMGGIQLFSQLKKEFPEVRFLMISGYGMEEEIKKLKQNGVLGFLHKPFLLSSFAREVRQALDRPMPPRNKVA